MANENIRATNNPYQEAQHNNKVVYGEQTLIDISKDTVTSQSLLQGKIAHDQDGYVIEGAIPTIRPDTGEQDYSNKITVTGGEALPAVVQFQSPHGYYDQGIQASAKVAELLPSSQVESTDVRNGHTVWANGFKVTGSLKGSNKSGTIELTRTGATTEVRVEANTINDSAFAVKVKVDEDPYRVSPSATEQFEVTSGSNDAFLDKVIVHAISTETQPLNGGTAMYIACPTTVTITGTVYDIHRGDTWEQFIDMHAANDFVATSDNMVGIMTGSSIEPLEPPVSITEVINYNQEYNI